MSKKIAIIEDEQPLLDMYKLKFEAEGFDVCTATNGKRGLEVIEQHKPDVILLDLLMPEMDGYEMLRALRKTEWGKNIKVIILTNVTEEEVKRKTGELKADGFIIKAQATPHQVVDKVKKVLGNKS